MDSAFDSEVTEGSRTALDYLQRIDTRSRGAAVLDALAEMIAQAGLGVGDRLPPEITLAQHLGVGRSTIREALNRWEGLGVIRRKRGSGTYLAAKVSSAAGDVSLSIVMEGEALMRILEVRRALEVEVTRLAVKNASGAQRTQIAALCDTLLSIVDARQPWRKADFAFHAAVYEASGNPLFGQIISHLEDAIERAPDSPFGKTHFGLASFPHHKVLSDGIVAGDVEMALSAVNSIIDSVTEEIRDLIAE